MGGVLERVGYPSWARAAFKLGQYGKGVARIDIEMLSAVLPRMTFTGGPMPSTTNTIRVDGTEQVFVGNEGIPGNDRYRVAMWWEGEEMVAWGKHESGRFPLMNTRRFLRASEWGGAHSELVVDREVCGVESRVVYARRK